MSVAFWDMMSAHSGAALSSVVSSVSITPMGEMIGERGKLSEGCLFVVVRKLFELAVAKGSRHMVRRGGRVTFMLIYVVVEVGEGTMTKSLSHEW